MYKDKARQKEAAKLALQRFRAKKPKKNVSESTTIDELNSKGIAIPCEIPSNEIPKCNTPNEIPRIIYKTASCGPSITPAMLIPNYGLPDCTCQHCQQNRRASNKLIINHGQLKTIDQLGHNEVNRVSLPGDRDYIGVSKAI